MLGQELKAHWSNALGVAGQLAGIAAKFLDGGRLEMRACLGAGKKPLDRALHFIVSTQQDERAIAEHGVAILGPFAVLDVDQHAFGVDVFGFEGNGFRDAQASGARVERALVRRGASRCRYAGRIPELLLR